MKTVKRHGDQRQTGLRNVEREKGGCRGKFKAVVNRDKGHGQKGLVMI